MKLKMDETAHVYQASEMWFWLEKLSDVSWVIALLLYFFVAVRIVWLRRNVWSLMAVAGVVMIASSNWMNVCCRSDIGFVTLPAPHPLFGQSAFKFFALFYAKNMGELLFLAGVLGFLFKSKGVLRKGG